ncbi:polysaccharide pyruvyl transferase family protein [Amycolatopsis aidingensis]|uniref:polysaccharide pyruvyl transferase family protein n=1 Tax=Amycolatopsis aidingensis TaxID=2842453 RepID=UPI001C0AEB89|nr:polysaccharide pyruvyl transferase family protein [Amycolatopsis aidingensis]
MRVLVTGWPSFEHGEATAGDVLGMTRVHATLTGAGIAADLAWSPGFRPGEPGLAGFDPDRYTHLVFACGPAHGWQLRELHERYARCLRIAVGVSVLDQEDPAVTGFHRVLARDDGVRARADLSVAAPVRPVPVAGVVLAPRQPEFADLRRHDQVHTALTGWLSAQDCALLELDTRLSGHEWRRCATPDQFAAVLSRVDVLATSRLHGLVFALGQGVPVLAVDPVAGGGKVTAQASVLGWPAVVGAGEAVLPGAFDRLWRWCLSAEGRAAAQRRRHGHPTPGLLAELVRRVGDRDAA